MFDYSVDKLLDDSLCDELLLLDELLDELLTEELEELTSDRLEELADILELLELRLLADRLDDDELLLDDSSSS